MILSFCLLLSLEVEEGLWEPTWSPILVPVLVRDWWCAWYWVLEVFSGLEVLFIRGWPIPVVHLILKCLSPPLVPVAAILSDLCIASVVISIVSTVVVSVVSVVSVIVIVSVLACLFEGFAGLILTLGAM